MTGGYIQAVGSREELVGLLLGRPRRKIVLVVSSPNCPACLVYEPMLNQFAARHSQQARSVVLYKGETSQLIRSRNTPGQLLYSAPINGLPTTMIAELDAGNNLQFSYLQAGVLQERQLLEYTTKVQ